MVDVKKSSLFWFCGRPAKITPTLFFAVFVTCFGSSTLFGYSMAILNNLQERIECCLYPKSCLMGKQIPNKVLRETAASLYGALTATFVVLGTFGAFVSGFVSNYFGRRNSLIINNVIAIVGGAVLILLLVLPHDPSLLFIGRLILGLNAGLTSGLAPTFIAEITPTAIRGAVTACHQFSITFGILVAYILTTQQVLNIDTYWPISLCLPIVPAFICLVVMPFLPESPRYLYINVDKPEKAHESFQKYNEIQDYNEQLVEIKNEAEIQKNMKKFRIIDLFISINYRKAIIISILLNVMQQFSGINAIIAYSSKMFSAAGVHKSKLELCVVLIGLLNCVCTIPAVLLLDVFGRRTLLIYPSILSCISLIGCFIMIAILPSIVPLFISWSSIIAVVFVCLYIVGFAIGMGPVPGIVVAEMFLQAPRAAAYSLALGIQWFSSFVILLLYPIIDNSLPQGYVFIIFFVIAIPCLIYLIIYMPETKQKSFAEITENLVGKGSSVAPVTEA